MTLVSVVIPAYNADKFIRECITSVLNQSHRPIEIVVVDDCSTDNTRAVVEELKSKHEIEGEVSFKIHTMHHNSGAAAALDHGCRISTGEYISWLSADDEFVYPGKTLLQLSQMQTTRADWSYCDRFIYGTDINNTQFVIPTYLPRIKFTNIFFERLNLLRFACLFWRNPIQGSSMMITRKAYYKYGGFNPQMINADADRDFWFRLSIWGAKLTVVHNITAVFYRIHPQQLSNDRKTMVSGGKKAKKNAIRAIFSRRLSWMSV